MPLENMRKHCMILSKDSNFLDKGPKVKETNKKGH